MEEILTDEQAQGQENLLKKRQEMNIEASSTNNITGIGLKITEKLQLLKTHCSRHNTARPCAFCEEEEHREAESLKEKATQERKRNPETILSKCGVGKAMLGCSFESFKGAEQTKALLCECLGNGASILLKGNTGTGKTHLAVATMRELTINFKINTRNDACIITVPELLMEIRGTFRPDSRYTETEIVEQYAKIPYLVLDDIGAEKSTDWSISTLYIIIDRRHRDLKSTIYTTNLSLSDIENHLGARIASRMAQAKVITLDLPDYRRKRDRSLKVAQ